MEGVSKKSHTADHLLHVAVHGRFWLVLLIAQPFTNIYILKIYMDSFAFVLVKLCSSFYCAVLEWEVQYCEKEYTPTVCYSR